MKLFSIILSALLCLSLSSCSVKNKHSGEILAELWERCEKLPRGVIYESGTPEGEENYMSPTLAEALYGERSSEYFPLIEEFSIYLSSFASPYEIAVFICYSSTDARKIERMCRERADIVSVALRHTEFYELCDNIRIVRKGNTVVFLMTDRPDDMARLVKRLI